MTDRSDEPTRRKGEKPTKDESAPVSQLPRDTEKEKDTRQREVNVHEEAIDKLVSMFTRMEPNLNTRLASDYFMNDVQASIAISLKRIADALEERNAK